MTMLSINTNVGALFAAQSSHKVNKSMETSMARLSSGKRINSASDDAAGIQIANRMNAEIRGLNQAVRNAADAQALSPERWVQTAGQILSVDDMTLTRSAALLDHVLTYLTEAV